MNLDLLLALIRLRIYWSQETCALDYKLSSFICILKSHTCYIGEFVIVHLCYSSSFIHACNLYFILFIYLILFFSYTRAFLEPSFPILWWTTSPRMMVMFPDSHPSSLSPPSATPTSFSWHCQSGHVLPWDETYSAFQGEDRNQRLNHVLHDEESAPSVSR